MRLIKIYLFDLTSHVVFRYIRQGSGVWSLLVLTARMLGVIGLLWILWLTGLHFDALTHEASIGSTGMSLVTEYGLFAFVIVFISAAIIPPRVKLSLRTYAQLPLSYHGVAFIDLILGLGRVPLLALLSLAFGLAGGVVAPHFSREVARIWILNVVGLGLLSHLAGTALHQQLRTRPLRFFLIAGVVGLSLILGEAYYPEALRDASRSFSAALLDGGIAATLFVWAAVAFVVLTKVRAAANGIDRNLPAPRHRRHAFLDTFTMRHDSPVIRMLMLEYKLLTRCSYPRYVMSAMSAMLLCFVALMVVMSDQTYDLIMVIFGTSGLSLSYAQLAFAWNSTHFDGLVLLPISEEDHVVARALLIVLLAIGASVVLTFIFVLAGVESLIAIAAAFAFTIGCVLVPAMRISMLNSRSVSLDGGAMTNARSFSWHFYASGFVIWGGVELLTVLTSASTAILGLFVAGILGMLFVPIGLRSLTNNLERKLPDLATRFRIPPG